MLGHAIMHRCDVSHFAPFHSMPCWAMPSCIVVMCLTLPPLLPPRFLPSHSTGRPVDYSLWECTALFNLTRSPGLRFTQELTTFTNLYGIFTPPLRLFTPFYAPLQITFCKLRYGHSAGMWCQIRRFQPVTALAGQCITHCGNIFHVPTSCLRTADPWAAQLHYYPTCHSAATLPSLP